MGGDAYGHNPVVGGSAFWLTYLELMGAGVLIFLCGLIFNPAGA